MPITAGDPNLVLLYGLDESGRLADRANAGSLGAAHDLEVDDAGGAGEGVSPMDDGNGGKGVFCGYLGSGHSVAGLSDINRWLVDKSAGDYATYLATGVMPTLPIPDATGNWAVGVRFKWITPYDDENYATSEPQILFGLNQDSAPIANGSAWETPEFSVGIYPTDTVGVPDDETTLTAGIGFSAGADVGNGTHYDNSEGASLPAQYIQKDEWYRVLVRVEYHSPSTYKLKVYIYEESTATLYICLQTSGYFNGNYNASNYFAWAVGSNTQQSPTCIVDEVWFYNAPVSDEEAESVVQNGVDIPWAAENYTYNDHDVRVSWTNEGGTFPVPRQLPVGTLSPKHVVGAWGTRPRIRYSGTRPSRPWALRRTEIQFDTAGPRSSKKNNAVSYDNANNGLLRRSGQLPLGSVVNVNDVEFSGFGPRRRRGFKVRRCVGTASNARNAFHSWRSYNDELHRFYKAGTAIYYENGSGAAQLQTGWSRTEQPSMAAFDNRMYALTFDKQIIWDGGASVSSLGIAAPTSGSVATGAGSLTGTYGYAYTFYDPTTGDESAPYEVGGITLAAQGAALSSLDASPADARFTTQRIYRTTDGGASPAYFFIDSQLNATTFTDGANVDGTLEIGRVGSDFITGTPPDTWAGVEIHAERPFFFRGATYPNRVYWGEANELQRWWADNFVTFDAPVNAVISRSQSLVVLTDRTVELLESDFIRDGNGTVSIRRTVLSRTVGCPGPNAICDVAGQPYWVDARGIFTLLGDRVQKVSKDIDNLFRYMNTSVGHAFSAGYNHLKEQVWFCVAMSSLQVDSSRQQTIIVLQLPENKWTLYGTEVTFCGQFDDDLNGTRFGGIDQIGCFKEFESYEGDGIDDPDDTASCEGTVGSIASNTITVSGTSPAWTTDALKGMGVVLRDVSTGVEYYSLITGNSADSFTVLELNANIIATDEYEIGGMRAFIEFSEQNLRSSNRKVVRFLYHEFDDLTAGNFV